MLAHQASASAPPDRKKDEKDLKSAIELKPPQQNGSLLFFSSLQRLDAIGKIRLLFLLEKAEKNKEAALAQIQNEITLFEIWLYARHSKEFLGLCRDSLLYGHWKKRLTQSDDFYDVEAMIKLSTNQQSFDVFLSYSFFQHYLGWKKHQGLLAGDTLITAQSQSQLWLNESLLISNCYYALSEQLRILDDFARIAINKVLKLQNDPTKNESKLLKAKENLRAILSEKYICQCNLFASAISQQFCTPGCIEAATIVTRIGDCFYTLGKTQRANSFYLIALKYLYLGQFLSERSKTTPELYERSQLAISFIFNNNLFPRHFMGKDVADWQPAKNTVLKMIVDSDKRHYPERAEILAMGMLAKLNENFKLKITLGISVSGKLDQKLGVEHKSDSYRSDNKEASSSPKERFIRVTQSSITYTRS